MTVMNSTVLEAGPLAAMDYFLERCREAGVTNADVIQHIALASIKHLRGSTQDRAVTEMEQELQCRWYDSLSRGGAPDYDVYATDYYLAEMWACWTVYSRKYLLNIQPANSFPPFGVFADLGHVTCVADLGCGIGFTTAALTELFPSAVVYATNLAGTAQAAIAQQLTREFPFTLVETVDQIPGGADLVFASEYFEHIHDPLDHLAFVLDVLKPKALLVANSFNTRAIGHFDAYLVNGRATTPKLVGRLFNKLMRSYGYQNVKTKLWNSRPTYWKRQWRAN